MKKAPFTIWMLFLIVSAGVVLGGGLVFLDIFNWGAHLVRSSAGMGLSLICSLCLIGIYKRQKVAKFAAIAIMIIVAMVLTGLSLFLLAVGQQEPEVMVLVRNGLIVSLFLIVCSVVFLMSKKMKKYFT